MTGVKAAAAARAVGYKASTAARDATFLDPARLKVQETVSKTKDKGCYIPVAGTLSRREFRRDDWYRTGSLFDRKMVEHGYTRVDQNHDPNVPDDGFWSGDVEGLLLHGIFGFWRKKHHDWWEGGRELARFLRKRYGELKDAKAVLLVAHSHGGQVVAYALQALKGQEMNLDNFCVITVDMPVRSGRLLGIIPRGMDKTYENAARVVGCRWIHLYNGVWAKWRLLGSRFGPRKFEFAYWNREVDGSHSGILNKREHISQWDDILAHVELEDKCATIDEERSEKRRWRIRRRRGGRRRRG